MYLSDIVGKVILIKGKARGVCLGIGISLKSYAVKYLFCASERAPAYQADFAVSISSVDIIDEAIRLSSLRPVYPKNCAKFFLKMPVYSSFGENLGVLSDVELRHFTVEQLFTDKNESYPVTAVSACVDAVILKKEQPYPIGQRIPAPLPSLSEGKSIVTKPLLKRAIQQGKLIELTLSLSPFQCFKNR